MPINFSIITPSYNRNDFIDRTIKSVIGQTYSNFEYIVVDGQSDDGTIDTLDRYHKKELLKYISEPDNGMYDAVNKGFRMASGEIIAYLNTDDIYLPWTLAVVAECFEANPDIDVVFGDSFIVDLQSNRSFLNIRPSFNPLWLYAGSRIAQPTLFFKKECFKNVGEFIKDVTLLADCEYWLRIIESGYKVRKINEFLAVEVNHEGTIRETKRSDVEKEKAYLIEKYSYHLTNPIQTTTVLNLKKMETVSKYLLFILKNAVSNHSGSWGKTLEALPISFRPFSLMLNKVYGKKCQVWDLDLERLLNLKRQMCDPTFLTSSQSRK